MLDGDVSLPQYALVALAAFIAAIIGGVTGYGTGLLLPPVLVPIIGPQAVVPVIAVAALMTNSSRLLAFRKSFDAPRAFLITLCAVPFCLVGAYLYTLLSGPHVAMLIGIVLILLVPVRRVLIRLRGHLPNKGVAAAGAAYGLLVGGTTGSGVVLLSILLAAGLQGPAVIATDAGISIVIGAVKTLVFQSTGMLPLSSWIMAAVIGVAAMPGAFIARRLANRLTLKAHTSILDAVVILGGALLIVQAVIGS
ncbi:sulfite exporter TauE/SafE family protein [Nordella sp. HKS 07]|uniref:sulfite exporter TauE/SafE family protein n=1 Tax=Nordella sp. HKS 07 TaxID=2712222 RepID=UPI0013E0F76C|nr:sulfite exporter TauE/SafE family protein [Nordella sp. HKS 07]QIG48716.1 sulfite exporter TauE/SafE family protein [Nordella sp. HKS 07]